MEQNKEDSKIADLFFGQTRDHLKCMSCQVEKEMFELFISINLCLPEKAIKPLAVEDLILSKSEIVNYTCNHCRKSTTSSKISEFTLLPRYLIVTIKRFSLKSKLKHKIKFREILSLTPLNS